jgi:hypothetical protein
MSYLTIWAKRGLLLLVCVSNCGFLQAQTAAKKTAAKPAPSTAHTAATPPPANESQIALADNVHTGRIECELDQHVNVQPSKHAGYLTVSHAGQIYEMKPVQSPTGALRLEDVKGTALMLQLGNKSMIMNTKTGRRLVDGCEHSKQKEAMEAHNRAKAEGRVTSVLQ